MLHTLADDLALKHIERGEQSGDAVTLVVVGHGAGANIASCRSYRDSTIL